MNVSIVIPTYNRLPILEKCLFALENQKLNTNISNYEVIVVDDGSTDGTTSWINKNKANLPHVILFQQEHGGPALGRNLGVIKSKYEIIIFIDSDLIVLDNFINCHVEKLLTSWRKNDKKCFTYGSVVNTSNFLNPQSEKHKIMDTSSISLSRDNKIAILVFSLLEENSLVKASKGKGSFTLIN